MDFRSSNVCRHLKFSRLSSFRKHLTVFSFLRKRKLKRHLQKSHGKWLKHLKECLNLSGSRKGNILGIGKLSSLNGHITQGTLHSEACFGDSIHITWVSGVDFWFCCLQFLYHGVLRRRCFQKYHPLTHARCGCWRCIWIFLTRNVLSCFAFFKQILHPP